MQAYDLVMLIVLAMATIFGAIKGFAWQVASIASVIVSYIVAYRFRSDVAELIHAQPPWNLFLAMLILYVGTSFVIWVAFRLLSGMIDRVRLKEFDRHLGAAFGLAKGLIYCLLITMFAMSLLGKTQQAAICQSRSGYFIATALDRGVGILPKEIHDVVGPYLTNLDEKLSDARNGTHSQTTDPSETGFNIGDTLNNLPKIGEGLSNTIQQGISQGVTNSIRDGISNFGAGTDTGQIPGLPPVGFPSSNLPGPNLPGSTLPNSTGQTGTATGGGGILPPAQFPNQYNSLPSGSPNNQYQAGQYPTGGGQIAPPNGTLPGNYPPANQPYSNSLRPVQQAQQPQGTFPR